MRAVLLSLCSDCQLPQVVHALLPGLPLASYPDVLPRAGSEPHEALLIFEQAPCLEDSLATILSILRQRLPETAFFLLSPRVDESCLEVLDHPLDVMLHWPAPEAVLRQHLQKFVRQAAESSQLNSIQHALRSSEERLSSLLGSLEDVVWSNRLGEQPKLELMSGAVEQVFGRTPDEFLSSPDLWLRVVPDEDQPIIHSLMAKVESEDAVSAEHRIIHASGEIRWIRHRAHVVRDEQLRAIRIDGLITDITPYRHVLERLERARDFLKNVIDAVADPLFVKDENHRWIEGNRAFWAFMNRGERELLGRSDYEFFPKHEADVFWAQDQLVFDTGVTNINEEELTDYTGRVRTLSTKKSVFRDASGRKVLVGVIRDITELKEMQRELEAARDGALQASQTKSRFLANMSHEIRTPMNAILGMTRLVLDTSLALDQREALDIVDHSAANLLAILDDILDISRLEAGRIRLEEGEFSLRELVEHTLETLAPKAHEKSLELWGRVAPELPDSLLGDPQRIRQVLLNLCGNAVKFTDSGHVVLDAGLESDHGDQVLRVDILDTGMGIPPSEQERIFQPFVQVEGSERQSQGGTGLGLAISADLVKLMGGSISVDSAQGRGSRFTVLLPLRTGSGAAPMPPRALEGRRIAFYDEHPLHRQILAEQLHLLGATVLEVGAALEEDLLRTADALILTHRMPDFDAFAAVERIQEGPRAKYIPCLILVTGEHLKTQGVTGRPYCRRALRPLGERRLRQMVLALLETPHPSPRGTTPAPQGGPLRVLIAEDNPVNALLAQRLLERLGHEALVAENGIEALEALHRSHFDLVLMDVQMPFLDGVQTACKIREEEEGTSRHLPIIALTANAYPEDERRCMEAGMDAYLSKPFDGAVLAREIRRVTRDRRGDLPSGVLPSPHFNLAGALSLADSDPDILRALCRVFVSEMPGMLCQVREGLEQQERDGLARAVHRLRGALGHLAVREVVALATQLEASAPIDPFEGLWEKFIILERAIQRLGQEVSAYVSA